jgi:phosphate acyltransferase
VGVRVALDLLGGDAAPEQVVDGALLARAQHPDVALTLVGPVDVAERLLAERDADGGVELVAASQVVAMDEDPARAVRAKRDATVRVACRLVRDGAADAVVSVGSTGAALAAAVFTLRRLPGVARPPLAAVLPSQQGPVVLLDAGASSTATPELLGQFALVGAAFARVRLGLEQPRVGLLSIGEEAGKGDDLRKASYDLLAGLPLDFVGNVEGHDVPLGGRADVVVTDGFTGNVLLKGLEGAAAMLRPDEPLEERGAVLLGVGGVVVVGHGAATPQGVANCVGTAVQAVELDLVARTRDALAGVPA